MPRWILPAVATALIAGCSPKPVVLTQNPPHYVMIAHDFGPMDADFTVRKASDSKADEVCRTHGRVAKLPAKEAKCLGYHTFFRYCMGYQYIYECVEKGQ